LYHSSIIICSYYYLYIFIPLLLFIFLWWYFYSYLLKFLFLYIHEIICMQSSINLLSIFNIHILFIYQAYFEICTIKQWSQNEIMICFNKLRNNSKHNKYEIFKILVVCICNHLMLNTFRQVTPFLKEVYNNKKLNVMNFLIDLGS